MASEESDADTLVYSDIEFKEEVGGGVCGKVHRVTFKKPYKGHTEAAAKNFTDLTPQEFKILSKLNHPHIIMLLGKFQNGPINLIFLEYTPFGSLHDYLTQDPFNATPENLLRKWARESALAVEYLHDNHVLHRDLKVKNCLLFGEDLLLKLSDFGLACDTTHTHTFSSIMGTFPYMAPEVVSPRGFREQVEYSIYSDIYAYGMLLLEICTKRPPFEGWDWRQITWTVSKWPGHKPDIPKDCPSDLADLILECLRWTPKDRPTIKEVLAITNPLPKPSHSSGDDLVLSKEVIPQLNGRKLQLTSAACFPDGDMFATVGADWMIINIKGRVKKVFRKADGSQTGLANPSPEIPGGQVIANGVAITPDGHILVCTQCSRDTVRIFNKAGKFIGGFSVLSDNEDNQVHGHVHVAGITMDKEGKVLVCDKGKQAITIHEFPSGELIEKINTKVNPIFVCTGTCFTVNSKNQIFYQTTPVRKGYPIVAIDHSGNKIFQILPRLGRSGGGLHTVHTLSAVCDNKDNIFISLEPKPQEMYEPGQPQPVTFESLYPRRGHIHMYSSIGAFMGCISRGLHRPFDLSILGNGSLVVNDGLVIKIFSAKKDNNDSINPQEPGPSSEAQPVLSLLL